MNNPIIYDLNSMPVNPLGTAFPNTNPVVVNSLFIPGVFKAILLCPNGYFVDCSVDIQPIFNTNNGHLNTGYPYESYPLDPCLKTEKYLIVWFHNSADSRMTAIFKEKSSSIKKCPDFIFCNWIWPVLY